MASGEMSRLLQQRNVPRTRTRSRRVIKPKNTNSSLHKPSLAAGQVPAAQAGQVDSLSSRNKLVQWVLRRKAVSNALSGATQLLLLAHTPVSRKGR